ncbi:MAG TPA: asparagine--tRNA ligase [Candidatus Dojkabacteria bacterium]|nr:asparagine--tRNA ligase [Candidatus Dojkabacteria bacterium]HQF36976.1 asparagine--tRNA ligase [Candidatus Dojkabacteria bacterium]
MAKQVLIPQFQQHIDQVVNINGWINNKRSSGSIIFLQIRDGFDTVQAVASKKDLPAQTFDSLEKITIESSVSITGIVKNEPRSPNGFELQITDAQIICLSPEDYPIQKKRDGSKHSIQFLFNYRHLHLRSQRQWAILRVRNNIINSIYSFLSEKEFTKIDSPILTPNACEGTTTLFEVPYTPAWEDNAKDGPHVYLTQSGQLYLESAIMSFSRVFDFGPVFRAEKSKTRRHLNEFWMMDAEMAFFDHAQNMKLQEELTQRIINDVLSKCSKELEILKRDTSALEKCTDKKYQIITHKEAIKILQRLGSDIKDRDDLGADDETILTKQFDTPIFVEKYPREAKAFYMKDDPEDNSRVLNADMLAPEGYGEVIGGSQREDNYDVLIEKIKKEKLDMDDFQWYLDLRKYGSVPHSGFGIGLERYVRWICGLTHIRETIPFPRTMKRIRP